MHDPKESATVELLENIFNKVLFRTRDDVFVNSQQPPSLESRKLCDIVIKYPVQGTSTPQILCFVECKRAKTTQPYSLRLVEQQAIDYCQVYLQSRKHLNFVYAVTACGAHVRLWKYSQGDEWLQGFWAGDEQASWPNYKDVGVDEDAKLITKGFDHMLATPPELMEGQSYSTYGTLEPVKGKGKQTDPRDQLDSSQSSNPKPLCEVQVSRQLVQDQEAWSFHLNGQTYNTWSSEWRKATIKESPAWFHPEHYAYCKDG